VATEIVITIEEVVVDIDQEDINLIPIKTMDSSLSP